MTDQKPERMTARINIAIKPSLKAKLIARANELSLTQPDLVRMAVSTTLHNIQIGVKNEA